MEARTNTLANLQQLREQLDSGRLRRARLLIQSLHPAEVAYLLESVPLQERAILWEMVDPEDEGDVLVEVADEVRDGLVRKRDVDHDPTAHLMAELFTQMEEDPSQA